MTLAALLAMLPDEALVPVAWVRARLAAENCEPGSSTIDDLSRADIPGTPAASTNGDRLLTAQDVAQRLHCSKRLVYARARSWPFTVREGRLVRFSAAGLDRWLARRP